MNVLTRTRRFTVIGCGLIAVAGVGFFTVADELRHIGEFFAVLGILGSGIAFLIAGLCPRWSTVLALQWTPVGIVLGMLSGAVIDRVVVGVSFGTALGLLLAYVLRARPSKHSVSADSLRSPLSALR